MSRSPTPIERGHEARGYRLPPGWDWSRVETERRRWGVWRWWVPLWTGLGEVVWGWPGVPRGERVSFPDRGMVAV